MDQTSSPSRVIEIATPPFKDGAIAKYFAECLIDTPFFINKKTREPSAFIGSIIIQKNYFMCELNITDERLEENFDDIGFVYDNHIEVEFAYIFNFQ